MLITPDQLPANARLLATDGTATPADALDVGELFVAVAVRAANVVNDLRENIRNLVGGRMSHYERLIDEAVRAALADLEAQAQARGYDGVIGVKISHPSVVDGGVEVVVIGNGFRRRRDDGEG